MDGKASEIEKCGCALFVLHHIKDVNDTIEYIDDGNIDEAFTRIESIKGDIEFIEKRCGITTSSAQHKVGVAQEKLKDSDRTGAKHWLLLSTDAIHKGLRDCSHGW